MLSRRFTVRRLTVDGTVVPIGSGDLVVVWRSESTDADWELVAEGTSADPVRPGSHHVEMVPAEDGTDGVGLRLGGRAFLVRQVGSTVVFRGDGPLDPSGWMPGA